MKKIIPILIVGALVLSGIGTIATEADDNTGQEITSFYVSEPTFSNSGNYVVVNLEEQTSVNVSHSSITANGQVQKTSGNVKLADDKAQAYTAQLYAYLDAIGKTDSVLFGHQNDITHKSGNPALANSDVKDITGSISAVMGIDALSLTGNELASAAWNMPLSDRVAACEAVAKEAASQGAIITQRSKSMR